MIGLDRFPGGKDRVWYATNVEVCRYILAQRRLEIAADESMIYNPSGIPVWVSRDHKDVFCIQPNETLHL